MDQLTAKEAHDATFAPADVLAPVQEMVQACIQCGTCTASCPNEFAMDHTPRKLWRMVLMGLKDQIFQSKTFVLCSNCYCCTLRCPRGLPLTEAMSVLKQVAARENLAKYRQSTLFYRNFLKSVRRHGRVNEMEFMAFYFVALRKFAVPLRFAPLGVTLMRKGKVSVAVPLKAQRPLESIFRKVEALEDRI
ncbi:MAG: 4Fe-4S dicluster domain-containing protein [Desulfobacterales bacterium]|jgi:heterodisulfide reductase subunit C